MTNIIILALHLITNSVTNATGITPTFGDGSTGHVQQVITAVGGQVVIGFRHEGQDVPLGGPINFFLSVKTNYVVGFNPIAADGTSILRPLLSAQPQRRGTNNVK